MNKINFNLNGVIFENFYSENDERVVKLTNFTGNDLEVKIHFYYSSAFFPFAEYKNIIGNGVWITPLSHHVKAASFILLYLNGENPIQINLIRNKKLKNISNKIICVGLNKTGTTSLTKSLESIQLNCWAGSEPINSLHFTSHCFVNNSIGNAIDIVEKTDVDFFQDIPFSCPGISEKIIKNFPQAKYILTTRDNPEKWVMSVKRFWKNYFQNESFDIIGGFGNLNVTYDKGVIHNPTYLLNMFETWELEKYHGTLDEQLIQVYENHNESVKKTLQLFGCDWIEINVAKKGEFKKLTDWLGFENKMEDFLWENKTV